MSTRWIITLCFLAQVWASAPSTVLDGVTAGRSWPRFGFGYTVSWTRDSHSVLLRGPDGKQRWDVNLVVDGADQTLIRDAAICPGGQVTLATTLVSKKQG